MPWPGAAGRGGPRELVEVGDAEEGVAGLEGVVEERERALLLERGQPEGELGHLDGQGVLVDAVEAVVGDELHGAQAALLRVDGEEVFGRRDWGPGDAMRPLPPARLRPSLDQAVCQVAAGLDEEGAGAHGRVADLELEEVGDGAQFPLGGAAPSAGPT